MRTPIILLAATCLASPALADHAGPSGVGGGSLNVFSPDTLGEGAFAIGFRMSYLRPEQRSDELLAALAGQHVHAHNTDYNLNSSLGLAYGATHELTLSFELPYVRRDGLREGTHSHVAGQSINGVEELGTVAGIGDASFLARYKVTDNPDATFALIGGLKFPTGSTHRHSNAGERLETEHQPGTGSFDPIAGAAFATKLGAVRLTASGLYQISGKGAQHSRLGDRGQAGIALSHRFGEPEHDHEEAGEHHHGGEAHHHAAPHGHQSVDTFVELTGEWEGRQKVDGEVEQESGGRAIWLSPGARFNAANGLSLGASVGVPVAQHIRASHPDNKYRLTISLGKSF
jgi:hypothetical protein